jgi:protein arginine kinase
MNTFPHASWFEPWITQTARGGPAWASESVDSASVDVVLSSRVRLARNLRSFMFMPRTTVSDRQQVRDLLTGALSTQQAVDALGSMMHFVSISALPIIDRVLLVERYLTSKEHVRISNSPTAGQGTAMKGSPQASSTSANASPAVQVTSSVAGGGAGTASSQTPSGDVPARVPLDSSVALGMTLPDHRTCVMINEEDHLRLQVMRPGLALTEAWQQASAIDDAVEASVDYAYSPTFGYLTTCPTNVGTAVRFSVMLHLPALRLTGEIDKVRNAANDMGLALRGMHGENTHATGDLHQLSNQVTLGKSEEALLDELTLEILPTVVRYERLARESLAQRRTRFFEDLVWRAFGVLTHARLLTPEEAIENLSLVRLGAIMRVLPQHFVRKADCLMMHIQQAHLQKLHSSSLSEAGNTHASAELNQNQRREVRARMCRLALGGLATGNDGALIQPE